MERGKKLISNNSLFLLLKMRNLWPNKENSTRNVVGKRRSGVARGAYFYAQGNPICQLLGDEELEWETIGEWFFLVFPKDENGEEK